MYRSDGPGCTAASYTGAIQWHSLLDSREQQSLRTWIVSLFSGSEDKQLAHSSGEWCFLDVQADPLVFGYVAMHCRYLAETKTLWEHLNSSADIFQFGASVAMHALMMSLQLRPACR